MNAGLEQAAKGTLGWSRHIPETAESDQARTKAKIYHEALRQPWSTIIDYINHSLSTIMVNH